MASLPSSPTVFSPTLASPTSQTFSFASTASYSAPSRRKVAIVGSGSAGIAALWALNRTHHDVYLYEAADRLGGHTNTVEWRRGKHKTTVDAGFMLLNTATYPNFVKFLQRIRVKTETTSVSLGVTRDDGQFEWADSSIARFFCQLGNVASPRMWRMVLDVVRFNHAAAEMVAAGGATTIDGATAAADTSAAQWLDANGYSAAFRDDYLMPRVAALWGISPDQGALQFPISMVARHLWDSRLLGLTTATAPSEEPTWLTLVDGSRSYVDAVMRGFPPNHLFLNTPVRSVRSMPDDRVVLELADGSAHDYDHVILACHGDEAYRLIRGSATPLEREILSQFQTVATDAVLHSDASVMPRSRTAWSGWNYATTTTASARPESAAITYNLNMLQDIPRQAFGDVLLTVNPGRGLAPRPETVQSRFAYRHGLCTPEAVAAQARLPEIQNTRGISYAGAWTRLGLHEDGISSGLAVARDHLGARLPFAFAESSTAAAAPAPRLGLLHYVVSVLVLLLRMVVAFVTAVGSTVDEETAMVQARAHGARVRVKETKAAVASGVRRVLQAGGQHGREGAAATGVNGVGVVRRQQVQNGVAH